MSTHKYQVGGSLRNDDPFYVVRSADAELHSALKAGEFCYVLNSRQMGKSSLLVRMKHHLQQEGFLCTSLDMTNIGSENITPGQWYKGVIAELWSGFKLKGKLNLKTWWRNAEELSYLQRLSNFINQMLHEHLPNQKLVIFVDEIDSILSLDFAVDDFFAFIRYCYNQRVINSEYNRITWAIFGVATPSDLIADKNRTPFNIGKAVELYGFNYLEAQPLTLGLEKVTINSETILKEILDWTDGQPFLTQKLCQLVVRLSQRTTSGSLTIPPGTEEFWVESIVRKYIIDKWESQDEPEHLRTIRDRLLRNEERAGRLLGIYQQMLQGVEVHTDDSREQIELKLSGLVVKQSGLLKVRNRIYQEVFNLQWVEKQLTNLRPYSQAFDSWVNLGQQDTSRLLRGQALIDAQTWAQGKSLSDLDYKFLAASVEFDRKEVQMRLEAERAKEVEARLQSERKSARRQQQFLVGISLALIAAIAFGFVAIYQYQQATVNEIRAIASSSEGQFDGNRKLDALVQAIAAKQKLHTSIGAKPALAHQVDAALQRAVLGADEFNRLLGHPGGVLAVAYSPDGELIATASNDRTVKLWERDGRLFRTLPNDATALHLEFSPDSSRIAVAGIDGNLRLWNVYGILERTIKAHTAPVWGVTFSPDGRTLASASADSTIKLWNLDEIKYAETPLRTLKGHKASVWKVAFSPDGQTLASASIDTTIKLWKIDGTGGLETHPHRTLRGHSGAVWDIAFSPDGNTFASASADNTVRLWRRDGTELETLKHNSEVLSVAFNPQGNIIASATTNRNIKLWNLDGTLLRIFRGHSAAIKDVAFSPDGGEIASASEDTTVKLWKTESPFLKPLYGHGASIYSLALSKDGQTIASASLDQTVKLWQRDGTLLKTITGHNAPVYSVAFSSDGQLLASTASDSTIKLWHKDGTELITFSNDAPAIDIAFSPDDELLISGGDDKAVKLWHKDGTLVKTLNGHTARVWSVAISPDGEFIASGSADGTVKLWTLNAAGEFETSEFCTLFGHTSAIWSVAISPDSQIIASASRDGTIKLWQRNGTLIRTIQGDSRGFASVSFSPDGQTIALAGINNSVTLWKTDGTLVKTLYGHSALVSEIAFSPDGKTILSGDENQTIILWNLEQILQLDELSYACNWVRDYLHTNREVEESDLAGARSGLHPDRHLCDNNSYK